MQCSNDLLSGMPSPHLSLFWYTSDMALSTCSMIMGLLMACFYQKTDLLNRKQKVGTPQSDDHASFSASYDAAHMSGRVNFGVINEEDLGQGLHNK